MPTLQQNGAQLIDDSRPLSHQPISRPMQRLDVELILAFQFDTNRIVGRVAASAIPSASRSSFFCVCALT